MLTDAIIRQINYLSKKVKLSPIQISKITEVTPYRVKKILAAKKLNPIKKKSRFFNPDTYNPLGL